MAADSRDAPERRGPPERATEPRVQDGFLAVGVALTSFGLDGTIKVELLTDFPDRFNRGCTIWFAGSEREIEKSRLHGRLAYVKLAGIATPEQVAPLRGHYLQVPESDRHRLPPDQYYQMDIIGLAVQSTADGEPLGEVVELLSTGANDVLIVNGPRGEILIPMIEDVVLEIDLEAKRVIIEPIPGLLPDTPVNKPPAATAPANPRRRPFRRRNQARRPRAAGQDASQPSA